MSDSIRNSVIRQFAIRADAEELEYPPDIYDLSDSVGAPSRQRSGLSLTGLNARMNPFLARSDDNPRKNPINRRLQAELIHELKENDIKAVRVEWCDLHGLSRGCWIEVDRFFKSWRDGFGFSSAAFDMDLKGEVIDEGRESKRLGWPSYHAVPILETLARCPLEHETAWVLAELHSSDRKSFDGDPRTALRQVVDSIRALGYACKIGAELEFYLLLPDGSPLSEARQAYRTHGGQTETRFRHVILDAFRFADLPIQSVLHEDGPSQYEATFAPDNPLEVADTVFRARTIIKEIAAQNGLLATFLSKPLDGASGNGFHLHQQVCDLESRSLFFDSAESNGMSALMLGYLAGQLHLLRPACAFYLPTINAYKRILTRTPLPLTSTWGFDNRTAAFRVTGFEESLRLENRVPGGEANPYLAIAASLASGFHGVREALIPPPSLDESERAPEAPSLPYALTESLQALAENDIFAEWLGRDLIEPYIRLKRGEDERHRRSVTDWDKNEYLPFL